MGRVSGPERSVRAHPWGRRRARRLALACPPGRARLRVCATCAHARPPAQRVRPLEPVCAGVSGRVPASASACAACERGLERVPARLAARRCLCVWRRERREPSIDLVCAHFDVAFRRIGSAVSQRSGKLQKCSCRLCASSRWTFAIPTNRLQGLLRELDRIGHAVEPARRRARGRRFNGLGTGARARRAFGGHVEPCDASSLSTGVLAPWRA